MAECPKDGKCPECGGNLTRDEDQDEDTLAYCGPACENCSWEHCGDCI
jgi:hypothetical protein